MKPGERVELIRELATALAPMEWGDIDLILRQFQLRWSDQWSGNDRRAYAMEMIESGTDDQLSLLADYLLGPQTTASTKPSPPNDASPWEDGYFRLFMSHINRDKSAVAELKGALEPYGIDAFVAHNDIHPTQEWIEVIQVALNTCDGLAAYLTNGYHDSWWTDQEVGFALARNVLVIPLKVECDPYGFMGRTQALPCAQLTAPQLAERIFETLADHTLTASAMTEPVVAAFERSDSFQEAKLRMQRVKRLKAWTPALLRRLGAAPSINTQIDGAWGVPEQVRALIDARRS